MLSRRGFGVTDLRDIVYGNLGVAGFHIKSQMVDFPPVDYNKSISEVFVDAACFIIESSEHLELLLHTETWNSENRRGDLPSWVPDWSLGSLKHVPPLDIHKTETYLRIGTSFCINRPSTLAYRADEVGVLQDISETLPKAENDSSQFQRMATLQSYVAKIATETSPHYTNAESSKWYVTYSTSFDLLIYTF